MISTVINMPTIMFNGYEFAYLALTPSAMRHWQERSVEIFSYIYPALDG